MRRMITDKLTKNIKEIVAAYQAGEIGAKVEVANITAIDGAILTDLKAGDIVVKQTGDMRHTYVVTYKEENKGICMTYFDAGYLETVSYDYVTNAWVYNSTDVVNITEDYALKSELPAEVSGTNDGTNWTSLTINEDTYDIPQGGGGSQLYAHNVCVVLYTDNTKETIQGMITATIINSNNTVINDVTKLGTALTSIQSTYRPLSANGSDGTHNVFGLVNDNGAAYEYFGSGSPQTVAISADTSWIGDEVVTL